MMAQQPTKTIELEIGNKGCFFEKCKNILDKIFTCPVKEEAL